MGSNNNTNGAAGIATDTCNSMVIESARILSAPVDGMLWIERLPRSCVGCLSQGGGVCACMWAGSTRAYRVQARLSDTLAGAQLTVGQRVEVGLPSDLFLKGALLFYFLPACALLLGAITGASLWEGGGNGAIVTNIITSTAGSSAGSTIGKELASLVGGLSALLISLALVRVFFSKTRPQEAHPMVLRVLTNNEPQLPDTPENDYIVRH
jgi:positive regulator of sigma E activity